MKTRSADDGQNSFAFSLDVVPVNGVSETSAIRHNTFLARGSLVFPLPAFVLFVFILLVKPGVIAHFLPLFRDLGLKVLDFFK